MAKQKLEQSKRRSFLLLLEHTTSINQLKNINEDWVTSILNHYLSCPSYLDKKLIPFYMEGFDKVLNKIMNKELFGCLKDIYTELIPYNSTKLDYPYLYIHFPQTTKSNLKIIKFDKSRPIKLRNDFDKTLMGFNAQYIYLLENDVMEYKIFDYEIKLGLISFSIKYDFIEKFNKAYGLNGLKSVIVFDEINAKLNGMIVRQVIQDGNVVGFLDKSLELKD